MTGGNATSRKTHQIPHFRCQCGYRPRHSRCRARGVVDKYVEEALVALGSKRTRPVASDSIDAEDEMLEEIGSRVCITLRIFICVHPARKCW